MMDLARDTGAPTRTADDLDALAVAAKDGDPFAFERLVRAVGPRMLAFATRVLGDRTLAEEAVQEALVKIYRFLPRYEPRNFLAWSFTVTHRACIDLAKRERRMFARSEPLSDSGPPSGEDHAEAVDIRTSVDAALAKLPGHLRTTFLLVQQGLTYEDAAGVLEIPIGTVRSRIHEARRLLRAMLAASINGGNAA